MGADPGAAVVSEEVFYAVRTQMADRDPRMGEAAVKTSTNLLTGRATCGCGGDGCGARMSTATGTSPANTAIMRAPPAPSKVRTPAPVAGYQWRHWTGLSSMPSPVI